MDWIERLSRFCGILIFLLFTSCTIYETVQIPTEAKHLISQQDRDKVFVLHDRSLLQEGVLSSVIITNDSIFGILESRPKGSTHEPHDPKFASGSVSAYEPLKVVHVYLRTDSLERGAFAVSLEDVIDAEIHFKDYNASKGATSALTTVVAIGGTAAAIGIACGCPDVISSGSSGEKGHGVLFPGAFLQSLQRDDYLILHEPRSAAGGELHLQLLNSQPETQFIDQVEVLEVHHPQHAYLALSDQQQLIAYDQVVPASSAWTSTSADITNSLSHPDRDSYQFDDKSSEKELSFVHLRFDATDQLGEPALVLRAQQSSWLDTVGAYIFHQAGRSYDKWVNRNDDSSPEKWRARNQRRGLSMNVYAKEQEEWVYQGTFHDLGTGGLRDLIMPLTIAASTSSELEIKLESAFKIWEVDFAGITNNWTTDIAIDPLELILVKTHTGEDVRSHLSTADGQYVIQDSVGSRIDLQVNGWHPTSANSLVLHGNGYYHRHSPYDGRPKLGFFVKLRSETGLQEISSALYYYQLEQQRLSGNESADIGSSTDQ